MSLGKVVSTSLAAVAAVLLAVPLYSAEYSSRVGSVEHALSLPDSAQVLLDGLTVSRATGQGYIFCRDPWAGGRVLPVWACANVGQWWSVEVTGYTKTVSGERIVVATRLRLYTDSKGKPFIMWAKGPKPISWPYMRDIPLGTTALSESIPPPPEPESPAQPALTASEPDQGTIAWALRQPVGAPVTIHDVICTADSPQPGDLVQHRMYDFDMNGDPGYQWAYFYVQDPDRPDLNPPRRGRSAGIRVRWDGNTTVSGSFLFRDMRVAWISGTIALEQGNNEDGEKQINADVVATGDPTYWPAAGPLGMGSRAIGGSGFGDTPGVKDPCGLYNKGLLIRTWGKVTYVDPAGEFCYIDDGGSLYDGNTLGAGGAAVPGVRALLARSGPGWQTDDPVPRVGQTIAVTGLSSSMILNGQVVRLVRQRSNYGRVISEKPVSAPGYGRGLMKTPGGDTYFTGTGAYSIFKYLEGQEALTYDVEHILGCLDLDTDANTFWGGLYESQHADECKLYHYSLPLLPPPAVNTPIQEISLPWLPGDTGPSGGPINPDGGMLDGLAVDSTDGTFWISSDLSRRVYHVDRNGSRIGSFDTPYPISGHEYAAGYLWLADGGVGGSQLWTIRKVDPGANGLVRAYFEVPTELGPEDLDWLPTEPRRLRGLIPFGYIVTWDLIGIEVIEP